MTDNSIQTKRLEIALEQYERLIFSICYRMVGDYFDAQEIGLPVSRAGTVSSPEERFLDEEIKGELQQACRDLKPPYGQVAYEFYCCDHTAREIADMRGVKLKTVQTQIGRAKKMLQKKLKHRIAEP